MKKDISVLKNEAVKEYCHLDKTTNIEFEGKETNFVTDILSSNAIEELNAIRMNMWLSYSSSILNFTEELIDSFCNRLADVKEYNKQFFELGIELNKISEDDVVNEKLIDKTKELFDKIWEFYIKTQKDEKNIINQSKKEFLKLYPVWLGIFLALYLNIIGWFFSKMGIDWLKNNTIILLLGLGFIVVGVWFFLKAFLYGGVKKT